MFGGCVNACYDRSCCSYSFVLTPCADLPDSRLSFLISVFINATTVNVQTTAYVAKVRAITKKKADEWNGHSD